MNQQLRHASWCDLDVDHEGCCHTAECGYSHNHDGSCWYEPPPQAAAIRRALLDQGRRPDVHSAQLQRLRLQWPTLYRAVMATLTDSERARLERA